MAPLVRTGGSRHTGLAAPPHRNIQDVKRIVAGKLQNLSVKVAAHYANVACPILTYQPKMSEEVKKLRRF